MNLAHLAKLEHLVTRDSLDHVATKALRDRLDHRDKLEHLASGENLDLRVRPGQEVNLDLVERLEHPELQGTLGSAGRTANPDLKVHREQLDPLDRPAPVESLAPEESLAWQDHLATLEAQVCDFCQLSGNNIFDNKISSFVKISSL